MTIHEEPCDLGVYPLWIGNQDLIWDGTEDDMYTHKPLKNADEIRLLCLRPHGDGVGCTIQHASLSKNPQYEALSYMWGPADKTRIIQVNRREFGVRENLYSALSQLQSETKAGECRVLWIDAMCINQEDINERNHQVAQMGRIYSQAQRVVVWLGEHDDTSKLGLESLIKSDFMKDLAKKNFDLRNEKSRIDAIKALCRRPYWERLWIIQENVLASAVCVQCGNDFAEWEQILVFFAHVDHITKTDHSPWKERAEFVADIRKSIFARLCRDWKAFRADKATMSPIYDLCIRYSEAKCHDPRDKFYGLLGISPECCRKAVPIDYTLSRYEICGMVLLHHMVDHMYDVSEPPRSLVSSNRTPSHIIRSAEVFHLALGIAKPTPPTRTRNHIIRSAQIFHLAMGITKSDAPRQALSSDTHGPAPEPPGAIPSPTPLVLQQDHKSDIKESTRNAYEAKNGTVSFIAESSSSDIFPETNKDQHQAQSRRRFSKAFGILRINQERKRIPASQERQSIPLPLSAHSKYPIQLAGGVTRIVHLSPQVTDSLDERLEWSSLAWGSINFHQKLMENIIELSRGTMSPEFDLIYADFEKDVAIQLPTRLHLNDCSLPGALIASALSEIPDLEGELNGLYNRIRYDILGLEDHHPGTMLAGIKIAIEENGLAFCVPMETRVDDLICLFSQSDAVAILRPTDDRKGVKLLGRGVGMLHTSAINPSTALPQWHNDSNIKSASIWLNLNVHALQILTRASSITIAEAQTRASFIAISEAQKRASSITIAEAQTRTSSSTIAEAQPLMTPLLPRRIVGKVGTPFRARYAAEFYKMKRDSKKKLGFYRTI